MLGGVPMMAGGGQMGGGWGTVGERPINVSIQVAKADARQDWEQIAYMVANKIKQAEAQ
jgi:hypothetical protein